MSFANQTGNASPEGFTSRTILQSGIFVEKFYTPFLCLFGALGNTLSLAVFCLDSKCRAQSSSYYLSALAVSDTGFLLSLFAVWLEGVRGGVITSDIMCPLVMYLGQVTSFISVYLTVAFSIERYIAVRYPLSRPRICTRAKAKKGILALTVMSTLLFSYAWFIAQVVEIKEPSASSPLSTSTENQIDLQYEQSTLISLLDDDDSFIESSFATKQGSFLNDYQNETSLKWTRRSGETTTTRKTVPFRGMRAEMKAQKWHNNDKNINGNGPIKTAQGNKKLDDIERQMGQRLDYTYLIDRNNGIQQRQQNDKKLNSIFSFGDTQKKMGSSTTPVTPGSQQNVSVPLNVISIDPHKHHQNCAFGYQYMCTVPKHYHQISKITNYLDTAVTLIIPFLLIAYFNVKMSILVWKLKDERQQIVASPAVNNNKASTLVVTKNPSGRSSLTQIANFLIPHGSRRCSRNDDLCSENAICHWNLEQQRCSVQFQDTSSRVCRSTPGTNVTTNPLIRENGNEITLNESTLNENHQAVSSFPVLQQRESCASDIIIRRGLSSLCRGEHQPVSHQSYHRRPSFEVRVTKTLLLVSTMFLLLNFPLHVIRCAQFFQSVTGTQQGKYILRALQPWANLLFNTNYGINVLLYCSGRNFKTKAFRILGKTSKPHQLNSSSQLYHHRLHTERNAGGETRKWWSRRRSSTLEGTRNNSQHGNPTIATVIKRPQTPEFFELEPIGGRGGIANDKGSGSCVHVAGNSNMNGRSKPDGKKLPFLPPHDVMQVCIHLPFP